MHGTGRAAAISAAMVLVAVAWALVARERPARVSAAAPSGPAAASPALPEPPPAELARPLERRTPVEAPAPPPAEAPPPASPPEELAAAEPTGEPAEPPLLPPALPAGRLEVRALLDEAPLEGARVLVHGHGAGGVPAELDGLLPHGLAGVTGADGSVAFAGLAPDAYTVRVLAGERAVLESTTVLPQGRGARVLAAFGTAAVAGRVFDDAGAPAPDCWISVRVGGQWSKSWAKSGPDGGYRVAGLPAEVVWVTRTCGEPRSVSVALDPGAEARVDFGWPGGEPTWSGTVRGSDGAAVGVAGRLTALRLENGERLHLPYGPDGRFELRLQPGRYAVSGMGFEASFVLGEVEVPPGGLVQDVVLPGARVVVELDYFGSQADPDLAAVEVRLSKAPGGRGRLAEAAGADAEGRARRVFLAVPPGDYHLAVAPHRLVGPASAAGSASVPLAVPEGAAVVHARVTVADP